MNVFAISDLHLPGGKKKPMDIFGPHWAGHFEKIQADWKKCVSEEDLVLLPGDISWAMDLSQAREDLEAIGALPGRKILLRGNHDYWWDSITKLRGMLPRGMYALQNDAFIFADIAVCGARGWLCPGNAQFTDDDARIYQRELLRLDLSMKDLERKCGDRALWRIAMLHFPPFAERMQKTDVTLLLEQHHIHDVVYGHLHGPGLANGFSGEKDGIHYHLVSCDGLEFMMRRLVFTGADDKKPDLSIADEPG